MYQIWRLLDREISARREPAAYVPGGLRSQSIIKSVSIDYIWDTGYCGWNQICTVLSELVAPC